jgi:hypothetical protein
MFVVMLYCMRSTSRTQSLSDKDSTIVIVYTLYCNEGISKKVCVDEIFHGARNSRKLLLWITEKRSAYLDFVHGRIKELMHGLAAVIL